MWFVLGLCGLAVAWPKTLGPVLILLGVFLGAGWLSDKGRGWRSAVDWPVLGLVLMLPISLWASSQLEITLAQVLRLMMGIVVCRLLARQVRGRQGAAWARQALLALLGGLAMAAPFSVKWATKLYALPAWMERLPQIGGDTVNPNVVGGYLALFLAATAGVLGIGWRELTRWERALGVGFWVLGAGGLVFSQARSAWLALGLALVFLLCLWFGKKWWVVGILFIGAIGITGWLVRSGAAGLANLAVGGRLESLQGRLEVWARAIYILEDFPFTGVGMGNFTRVTDALYPLLSFMPNTVEHAHNLLLQIGVDLGLAGLVCWISIFLLVSWAAWREFLDARKAEARLAAGLAAGMVAGQIVLFSHGLLDAVFWGMVRAAPLVWVLWGIALGLGEKVEEARG